MDIDYCYMVFSIPYCYVLHVQYSINTLIFLYVDRLDTDI